MKSLKMTVPSKKLELTQPNVPVSVAVHQMFSDEYPLQSFMSELIYRLYFGVVSNKNIVQRQKLPPFMEQIEDSILSMKALNHQES